MARFIDVLVEEHDDLPEGCSLRFRAQDAGAIVERIMWESDSGTRGVWRVEGRTSGGERTPAVAHAVDDSSAGTSILIVGGEHGLRLTCLETAETVAEPYLLVSRGALLTESLTE
ncbi:MAG TPA: hypothetical protein VM925_11090 [Labilithrix sp.]|nr:hypothetical protein [Labilithrix sp.]